MYKPIIIAILILLGNYASRAAFTAVKVSGSVVNAITGAQVPGVSFYTMLDNRRKLLCKGDTNGRFNFDLSETGQSIIVEKNGYRSASAPVNVQRLDGKSVVFYIQFPLIPLDKQALDSPYMQSEQKDYTLAGSAAAGQSVVKKVRVFDAITGKQIDRASVLLTYTKGKKTESKEITPGKPDMELRFTQADIVGFSIKSPGYQTYTGNLILERIDGSKDRYDIRLSPQINLLSLYLSGSGEARKCSLISGSGQEIKLSKADQNAYCALVSEGSYGLQIFRGNGSLVHTEEITLAAGLNFIEVGRFGKKNVQPPLQPVIPIVTEMPTDADTADFAPYELTTVYFNQSEYLLKQEEKDKLDMLASRIRAASGQQIRLVGHTDNVGDPKKNLMLSEYRVRVIRSYLLDRQVPERQILFTWVGGKFPVRTNDSEENKRMNRRVEITVLPKI